MGQTANKLASAFRTALEGGWYDAHQLRTRLVLTDGVTTDDLVLNGRVQDDAELENSLYGGHPKELGEWNIPTMNVEVLNHDALYTPGNSAGHFPTRDLGGWVIEIHREERVTSSSWTEYWLESLQLAEVQTQGAIAVLLCAHPLAGYLTKKWKESQRHDIDWNGQAHTR